MEEKKLTPTVINFFDKEQFETLQRVCKVFANSELVPDIYKTSETNPEPKAIANNMIALEMAGRIGASPLMVMQNMAIVYGKPSWSSSFLIATINSCGKFKSLKFKFIDKGMLGMVDYVDYEYNSNIRKKVAVNKQFDGRKIKDIECIAYTTEKDGNDILESSPVSIRLAIQEGWYTKAGSKWKTMTKQMLMYRAASFWQKTYAPELSMGMRTIEETQDIVDIDYEEVQNDFKKEIQMNANKKSLSMSTADNAVQEIEKAVEAEAEKQTVAEVKEEPKEEPKEQPNKTLFAEQSEDEIDPGF